MRKSIVILIPMFNNPYIHPTNTLKPSQSIMSHDINNDKKNKKKTPQMRPISRHLRLSFISTFFHSFFFFFTILQHRATHHRTAGANRERDTINTHGVNYRRCADNRPEVANKRTRAERASDAGKKMMVPKKKEARRDRRGKRRGEDGGFRFGI